MAPPSSSKEMADFITARSPSLFFRGDPEIWFRDELLTESHEQPEEQEEVHIYCRGCLHAVTSSFNSIQVSGRHYHTFPNPLGIVFEIGCFSEANGCTRRGETTSEFSWFPGFSWCFALCSGCRAHLGWHFSSQTADFYGLIMANLLIRDA
jgi:hypothetical protein